MTELALVVVAAALVNNVVLVQSLGVPQLLGATERLDVAMRAALMTGLVMTVAAAVTHLVERQLLLPYDVAYLRLIAFSVAVVLVGQATHTITRRFSPAVAALETNGADLVTANAAVLGVALLNATAGRGLIAALLYAIGAGLGFGLALVVFTGLRERLAVADAPAPFRGAAIAFVTAGILSLAFLGFAGFARL